MRINYPALRLLALLLPCIVAGGAVQAQNPPRNELFQPVILEADKKLPSDMHLARRYQPVQINMPLLNTLQPGQTITLTPFPDRTYTVQIEVRENYQPGLYSLRGRVPGLPDSLFALTVCGDAVALDLNVPFQPELMLRYVEKGMHLVCERTPMPTNFCATENNKDPLKVPMPGGNIGVQAVNVVDILVFVTPQVRANWGGIAAARANSVNAINYANAIHSQSSTNAQLRLLDVIEVAVDESGSYSSVINRFASNSTVLNARNRYQADLCELFISRTDGGTNGIGNLPGSFSVTYYGEAGWVGAHETGHNFGCGHAPEDSGAGGIYPYSNGHNHGDGFFLWLHTVMAYNRGAIAEYRMPYYSQPGVYYESSPGVYWETGTNDRNNARTIRETGATTAGYRNVTNNVYVNPILTWINSNGSEGAPWTSPLVGIDNVSPGGTVHIAGPFNYNQQFTRNKNATLRLWSGTNPPVNIGKP